MDSAIVIGIAGGVLTVMLAMTGFIVRGFIRDVQSISDRLMELDRRQRELATKVVRLEAYRTG